MNQLKIKNQSENINEYYCSLWMKDIIDETFSVSYIGKLSNINENFKFDIIIDESMSNYVYIKNKLNIENYKINFNQNNEIKLEIKQMTIYDVYKPVYDKLKSLWNADLDNHMEFGFVFDYIIFKYKQLIKSKQVKTKCDYDFVLTNNKVDRDSGKSLTDEKNFKYIEKPKTYNWDLEPRWLKEEFINEITDKDELYIICEIFSAYEYEDENRKNMDDENYSLNDDLRKQWLEVVKVIRIMIDFMNKLDKEECVKEVYDYYNNQIDKLDKLSENINRKEYIIKLLTLHSLRFMVEDDHFIYYTDFDNNINIIDYIISNDTDYDRNDEEECEITNQVKIKYEDDGDLYYEDCYDFQSLDGYIRTEFDNYYIPEILHKKYFNYILSKLNEYVDFQ
jgi:hypothetical protein